MLLEQCLNQFFAKRIESKRSDIYKCVLCNMIFRDIRLVPDFYARYIEKERGFEAGAERSEVSESDGESCTSGKAQTKDLKLLWPMELSVDDPGHEGRAKLHWLNWRHGIPHGSDTAHNSRYVINATFQVPSGGNLHEVLFTFSDRTMVINQLESNLLDHLLLFLGGEEGNNEYNNENHDAANENSYLLGNEALLPRNFNLPARRSPSVDGELEELVDESFFFRPPESVLQSTDVEDHDMDQSTHISVEEGDIPLRRSSRIRREPRRYIDEAAEVLSAKNRERTG